MPFLRSAEAAAEVAPRLAHKAALRKIFQVPAVAVRNSCLQKVTMEKT